MLKYFTFSFLILSCVASNAGEPKYHCSAGAEGTYVGKIGSVESRINVFCLDQERLMASLDQHLEEPEEPRFVDSTVNFNYANVDGDQLIFSNFQIANQDRRLGSSKSKMAYLRLDRAALQSGRISGKYMCCNLPEMRPVLATRVQTYPRFPND
jgi:hypothetical protein